MLNQQRLVGIIDHWTGMAVIVEFGSSCRSLFQEGFRGVNVVASAFCRGLTLLNSHPIRLYVGKHGTRKGIDLHLLGVERRPLRAAGAFEPLGQLLRPLGDGTVLPVVETGGTYFVWALVRQYGEVRMSSPLFGLK